MTITSKPASPRFNRLERRTTTTTTTRIESAAEAAQASKPKFVPRLLHVCWSSSSSLSSSSSFFCCSFVLYFLYRWSVGWIDARLDLDGLTNQPSNQSVYWSPNRTLGRSSGHRCRERNNSCSVTRSESRRFILNQTNIIKGCLALARSRVVRRWLSCWLAGWIADSLVAGCRRRRSES